MADINTSSSVPQNQVVEPNAINLTAPSRRQGVQSLLNPITTFVKDNGAQKLASKDESTFTKAGATSAAVSGGIAGLSAIQNISNAESAYDALKEQNKVNALELDRAEGILLMQGHQSMLDLKRAGEENSVSAQLALAAQGQNLNSSGAEKVSESYKTMGLYDALIAETNMLRGVYDINFQRIEMKRMEGLAKAQKKNAVFSGILSTAASAVGGYFGGAAGAQAAGGITSSLTQQDFSAQ